MGSFKQILLYIGSLRWTGNEHTKPYFLYTKRCCFSIKSNLIPLLASCIAKVRPAKPPSQSHHRIPHLIPIVVNLPSCNDRSILDQKDMLRKDL